LRWKICKPDPMKRDDAATGEKFKRNVDHSRPGISKYSPWSSGFGIIWDLIRNAKSKVPQKTCWNKLWRCRCSNQTSLPHVPKKWTSGVRVHLLCKTQLEPMALKIYAFLHMCTTFLFFLGSTGLWTQCAS
jgi:hypothetical protein